MDYTLATLNTNDKDDWFVYYSVRNPANGRLKPYKERAGINRVKDLKERKREAALLVHGINAKLKEGWSPLSKPEQKDKNRLNFYWWFDAKIASEKARPEGYYNWRKLETVYKKLKAFAPTLSIHDIDYKFLMDLQTHLIANGDGANYIADTFVRISGILKPVMKSGDIKYHENPFNDFKSKTTKVKKTRITLEEVKRLEVVKLTNPNEDLARDMYIFSYYLAGMRFGDICRVKKSWFKGGYINYTMNKGKTDRKIKLMKNVIRIIKKYKNSDGEYLFDTKVKWGKDELKSINSRNHFYNKKLKKACLATVLKDKNGEIITQYIPEVTFHTARHSFGKLARKKKIDIYTLKGLYGHSKVQTTEDYQDSIGEEESDEAMDQIFGK